jgi:hypothetical protein
LASVAVPKAEDFLRTDEMAGTNSNTIPNLNPMSNYYYVLRLATEFKVIYMDSQSAAKWSDAGWEVRRCDSNDQAQVALAEWKAKGGKPKLFLVKRPA